MESEDKRVNQLTQIASAPVNGIIPIDVPGSTAANGITVANLFKDCSYNQHLMGMLIICEHLVCITQLVLRKTRLVLVY